MIKSLLLVHVSAHTSWVSPKPEPSAQPSTVATNLHRAQDVVIIGMRVCLCAPGASTLPEILIVTLLTRQ